VPISALDRGYEHTKAEAIHHLRGAALAEFFIHANWLEFVHYSLHNGRGLCAGCHNARHATDEARR